MYNGIYFTNDDKAYVIGIIDSLTEYDMKKKGEYALKKVRYGSPMTPEGFPGSSCQNPEIYSERFKKFVETNFVQEPEAIAEASV